MSKLIIFFVLLCMSAGVAAQVVVKGVIFDEEFKEPLAGASVLVRDADGKIRKFDSSAPDGSFAMSLSTIKGCHLEVSMIGFVGQSLALDSITMPVTIYLSPGVMQLKEVAVKADRIREQGDTITYIVGSFARESDRTIGDVLRRMPGINVEESGKIQYQGTDINKFYIEGSDLLGGKYGIATNGINYEDIGAVEVMENHQPMQVLSGISFSDNVAINLKLKDKSKAVWTGHGYAVGGLAPRQEGMLWDADLFAMAIKPDFQNITTFKTNNIGHDLSAQANDFLAVSRNTALSDYINVRLPAVAGLSSARTLFNRSALLSTNSLFKVGRGEFKAQIDYVFNRLISNAQNVTTYFLEDGMQVVTDNQSGLQRQHAVSAKFVYELNHRTAFVNNTLRTNIDRDDIRLDVSGSLTNNQSMSMPQYFISNDFKLIKRFKNKHLVTFKSANELESRPENLVIRTMHGEFAQSVSKHALFTQESAAYSFILRGLTVSLEGGVRGYIRALKSDILTLPEVILRDARNDVYTNYLTFYASPKIEYGYKHVNINFSAPVSYAHYAFGKAMPYRNEGYFSPSLRITWKPANRLAVGLRGTLGRAPMNFSMLHPGYIMTDYRSFHRGVNEFYSTTSQNVSMNFTYRYPVRGVFANTYIMYSWLHLPYMVDQQLFGDYTVYSYANAKSNRRMLMTSGGLGKSLDFLHGSVSVNYSFMRNISHLNFENNLIYSAATSWSTGLKIDLYPVNWCSVDYKLDFRNNNLSNNGQPAAWLGNLLNVLTLNFMPCHKCEWRVGAEYYRNELQHNKFVNVLLVDTKLIYKPNRHLELSALFTNALNRRVYSYTLYSQTSSFTSQRQLRGREFLLSIAIK